MVLATQRPALLQVSKYSDEEKWGRRDWREGRAEASQKEQEEERGFLLDVASE